GFLMVGLALLCAAVIGLLLYKSFRRPHLLYITMFFYVGPAFLLRVSEIYLDPMGVGLATLIYSLLILSIRGAMLFNPHSILGDGSSQTEPDGIAIAKLTEVLKTYHLYFTVSLAITGVVSTTFLLGASSALKDLLGDGNEAKNLKMPLH